MLTIYQGEPENYKQAIEFMEETIETVKKIDDSVLELRHDIYLLVKNKVHEAAYLNRYTFFKTMEYKTKLNKKLVYDLVNAALVECQIGMPSGVVSLQVLLALRDKANKEDWKKIYDKTVFNIAVKRYDKNKRKPRRPRHFTDDGLSESYRFLHPAKLTEITKEINLFYKDTTKTRPKYKSIYEYWDDVVLKTDFSEEKDEDWDLINAK